MRTVLKGGSIFHSRTGTIARGDIALVGSQIAEIGTDLRGDDEISVAGHTLLPGMFDCHTHVTISDMDFIKGLETPLSYRFYQAAKNLEATLAAGITTIRDAAGADLGIKRAVNDGLINGPRMHISIRLISQTGGCGDEWTPCGQNVQWFSYVPYPGSPDSIVDGPEEMRKKVRELIRAGADVLKVATTGAVMSTHEDPASVHFRMDELTMLVAEATAANRFVMAHALNAQGIKNAVRAGVRSIEHGTELDDEAIQLMLEHGTFLVPTLIADPGIVEAADSGVGFPEERRRIAERVIEMGQRSYQAALSAGVKIAMGSDSAVTPHGDNLRELVLMHKLGMTAEQTLIAATLSAAECMGLDGELGSLEPGKTGDVVVVEGDPLELATLRQRIRTVFKDGRRVIG
jgi:imidazolonepropionase-like amidohydrolase